MAATHFSGPIIVNGVTVIDANGNIDAPVTTTDLSTTGNTTLGSNAADTLDINATISDDFLIGTNKKIQLRDTGLFIYSSADGKITISADGSGNDDINLDGTVKTTDDLYVGGDATLVGQRIEMPGSVATTSFNITSKTSPVVILDSTGGAITVTCDAAGIAGQTITFLIKAGPGTNNIVFDPGSFGYFASTTLGATTEIGKIITAVSDGSKWFLGVTEDVHA